MPSVESKMQCWVDRVRKQGNRARSTRVGRAKEGDGSSKAPAGGDATAARLARDWQRYNS